MFSRISLFRKLEQENDDVATLDKLNETLKKLEKKENVLLEKVNAEKEKAKNSLGERTKGLQHNV